MNKQRTITAAVFLIVSGAATAETPLTSTEMDGVNAGGFAFADAIATALGEVTSAFTNTVSNVIATNIIPGQFGAIFVIDSDALAEAASDSDAKAIALASGWGATQGTALSDTESVVMTQTDTDALLPYSISSATNTSLAASIIIGLSASASSASSSTAALSNAGAAPE